MRKQNRKKIIQEYKEKRKRKRKREEEKKRKITGLFFAMTQDLGKKKIKDRLIHLIESR